MLFPKIQVLIILKQELNKRHIKCSKALHLLKVLEVGKEGSSAESREATERAFGDTG